MQVRNIKKIQFFNIVLYILVFTWIKKKKIGKVKIVLCHNLRIVHTSGEDLKVFNVKGLNKTTLEQAWSSIRGRPFQERFIKEGIYR